MHSGLWRMQIDATADLALLATLGKGAQLCSEGA
eukprot:COSAG01_NODE_67_length_29188_cov_1135.609474_29_plen_34_part_00